METGAASAATVRATVCTARAMFAGTRDEFDYVECAEELNRKGEGDQAVFYLGKD